MRAQLLNNKFSATTTDSQDLLIICQYAKKKKTKKKMAKCVWLLILVLSCVKFCGTFCFPEVDIDLSLSSVSISTDDMVVAPFSVVFARLVWCTLIGNSVRFALN